MIIKTNDDKNMMVKIKQKGEEHCKDMEWVMQSDPKVDLLGN